MTFSIQFVDRMLCGDGTVALVGDLVLNEVTELFTAAVDAENGWTQADYERQWRDGLKRIVDGKRKSCLVTSLAHPSWSNALSYWPMYRVDEQVAFRERILPPDKLPRGFNPARPYGIVPDKPAKRKVPEWRISFADIVDFYQRMAASRNENLIDTRFERPEYFCPEEHPRAALEAEFESGNVDRAYAAFLNAAYYHDADWVQAKCIDALTSPIVRVRAGALEALQILAAVRKELDPFVVVQAVRPLADDPDSYVRQVAKDVLADIKSFFGQ